MSESLTLHVGLPRVGTGQLKPLFAAARHDSGPLPFGRSLLSAEALATADVARGRRLLDRLGADPGKTTVVIIACDLGRLLPLSWQADVETGSTRLFERYLETLIAGRGRPGTTPAWTSFDLPAVAARWSRVVGCENVAVTTVPPQGAPVDLLATRFAVAAGLPVDAADRTRQRHLRRTAARQRPSAAQTQLLRSINEVLEVDTYAPAARRMIRNRLLEVWRRLGPPPGPDLVVPTEFRTVVHEWAAADVARLRLLGIPLVGSLADLAPGFGPAPGDERLPTAEALARDVLTLLRNDRFGAPPIGPLTRAARAWTGRWRRSGSVPSAAWPVVSSTPPRSVDPGAAPSDVLTSLLIDASAIPEPRTREA